MRIPALISGSFGLFNNRLFTLLPAFGLALMLTACGGGDSHNHDDHDHGDQPKPEVNLSGIWQLQASAANAVGFCTSGNGNASYLQNSALLRYISIVQAADSSLTVTYQNGITATGTLNSDNSITLEDGQRNWTDTHGYSTSISLVPSNVNYIPATSAITGSINQLVQNDTRECSVSFTISAVRIHTPPATLDAYSGVYDTEMLIRKDTGFTNREYGSGHMVFSGSNLTIAYIDGDYGQASLSLNYDPQTGIATFNNVSDVVEDINGDETNDLSREVTDSVVMFVRDPADTSGATLVWTDFNAVTRFFDTDTYDDTAMADIAENGVQLSYARRAATRGFTHSNRAHLADGSGFADYIQLGLANPPLVGLDAGLSTEVEVVEDFSNEVVFRSTYGDMFRTRTQLPLPDMTVEAFSPRAYAWLSRQIDRVERPIRHENYTINLKDSTGENNVYSYTFTATPAPSPAYTPARTLLSLNGARVSQTERGNVVQLYGYFNPTVDLPVDATRANNNEIIDFHRLRLREPSNPKVLADIESATNSFTISRDDLNVFTKQGGSNTLDMRYDERYRRGVDNLVTQAIGRWMQLKVGVRGLVNIEILDPSELNFAVAQFWLDTQHPFAGGVECSVTHLQGGSLSCSAGEVDYANNAVVIPIVFNGQSTTMTITFSDSVTGTVNIPAGMAGSWTGGARIVNPELVVRSRANGDGTQQTNITMMNPLPLPSGTLSSRDGSIAPTILWDGNYNAVYNSYVLAPVDDRLPQRDLTYVPYNNGGAGLLSSDRFILSSGGFTYGVDYFAPDPSAMVPLQRTDISFNDGPASGYPTTNPNNLPIAQQV